MLFRKIYFGGNIRTDIFLFIIAFVAVLSMAAIVALAVLEPAGAGSGYSYITVSASGESYGYPQVARLYVSMNGTGSTAAIAYSNLSLTASTLNFTMQKYIAGNSSNMKTEAYSLQKVYNKSYYEASETVVLYIPQVQNVTGAIDALSQVPGVSLNQASAELSSQQDAELTQSALRAALSNATAQAETLSGNKTLEVNNITVSRTYIYPYIQFSGAAYQQSGQSFFSGIDGVQEQITAVFSYR